MSPEPRCDQTDLLVSGCAHCRPPLPLYELDSDWPVLCAACGRSISPGALVRDDGAGGVLHPRH